MQRNIIIELMESFSPKFISKAALALKETESGISEGLNNLVPSILYQLNHQLNRSDASQFFQLLKNEKNISLVSQLDGFLKNKNGELNNNKITKNFVEKLFDRKPEGILDFVSQHNQLKNKSSQSLMTVASALVMGHLSKMIRKEGLQLNSFKTFLFGQQDNVEAALPSGMTNWLGTIRPMDSNSRGAAIAQVSKSTATATASATAVSDKAVIAGASSGLTKYLWLLPLLLFLFLGGWYFLSPSSTVDSSSSISQLEEKTTAPVDKSISEVSSEVKDELTLATDKIVEENKISTTDNSTGSLPISGSKNETESRKIVKKGSIAEVKISEPELIEEVYIEATSSPGKVISSQEMYSKGGTNTNNTNTNTTNSNYSETLGVTYSGKNEVAEKVRYEDYIKKVNMPELDKGALVSSKIESESKSTILPPWYKKSKEVVNGNSSHVTITKKTEMIIESRNTTSDALSELRKSLSLTTYNAWFGHITNPISSTEYRLYSYLSGKNKNAYQTDKYSWFTLDKVSFPNYDSKMNFDKSKGQLGRIANILNANPDVTLKIGGFTSDLGKKRANRKLSLEMAEQTKAALVKLGVDESRISVKGYGESNPLGLNDTELGRMRNHRVGFRVMAK